MGKEQLVVARSSFEVECQAMADETCELLWLKILFQELGFTFKKAWTHGFTHDSTCALNIATNTDYHEHAKHM